MFKLNSPAVEYARELAARGRVDDLGWLPFQNMDALAAIGAPGAEGTGPDFSRWFLGVREDVETPTLADFAYPFGRVFADGSEPLVNVEALRQIRHIAAAQGELDVWKVANEMLGLISGHAFSKGEEPEVDPDGWWIEILATGTWTDAHGNTATFTREDLDEIVLAHEETCPQALRPPFRLGDHPEISKDRLPATGWAGKLKREGEKLLAYISHVPEWAVQMLKERQFRSASSGLRANWSFGGKVYKWALDHVAILGAHLPAVDGLSEIMAHYSVARSECQEFTRTEEEDQDMNELEKLKQEKAELETKLTSANERITALEQQTSAFSLREAEAEVFAVVDGAVKSGRALPADEKGEKAAGLALRQLEDHEQDGSPFHAWKQRLSSGRKVVEFSEKATGGGGDEGPTDDKDLVVGAAAAKAVQGRS